MQDGTHLATKIRNRLLSETATLCNSDQKIEHNLVKSDIFHHDRQNYASCLKITSDDVLTLLTQ